MLLAQSTLVAMMTTTVITSIIAGYAVGVRCTMTQWMGLVRQSAIPRRKGSALLTMSARMTCTATTRMRASLALTAQCSMMLWTALARSGVLTKKKRLVPGMRRVPGTLIVTATTTAGVSGVFGVGLPSHTRVLQSALDALSTRIQLMGHVQHGVRILGRMKARAMSTLIVTGSTTVTGSTIAGSVLGVRCTMMPLIALRVRYVWCVCVCVFY